MMNWWLRLILKMNNQIFNNNQNLNHQIVPVGNEIIGWKIIKYGIVKIVNILSTNKNIRLIKKVRRQDNYFSTRLPNDNKMIRERWLNMINTTYNTTEDMNSKIQSLKGKAKLKFYKI